MKTGITIIKTTDDSGLDCFLVITGNREDRPVKKYTLQGLVDELGRHRDCPAFDVHFVTEGSNNA